MKLRGRHWIALGLVAFGATAGLVVWRQTDALAAARELAKLETTLHALESTRATTAAAIRHAESRAVLVPLVESRLRLRVPQDSDIVILQYPWPRWDSGGAGIERAAPGPHPPPLGPGRAR